MSILLYAVFLKVTVDNIVCGC